MEVSIRQQWLEAWNDASFRKKTIAGSILLLVLLTALPFFFQAIQRRSGTLLDDWLLEWLPVHNMSVPIFICIWAVAALTLVRVIQSPSIFIIGIWSYCFLTLSRMISIGLFPLEPPKNLRVLTDPLSNAFYGESYITKDLFYSGHTSTVFLMFLVLQKRNDKIFAGTAALAVGVMLLLQHVHYTIDVIAAPFFTYGVYWLTQKLVKREEMNF